MELEGLGEPTCATLRAVPPVLMSAWMYPHMSSNERGLIA